MAKNNSDQKYNLEKYIHKEKDGHFFRFGNQDVRFWFTVENDTNCIYSAHFQFVCKDIPNAGTETQNRINSIEGYLDCNEVYDNETKENIYWITNNNLCISSINTSSADVFIFAEEVKNKAQLIHEVTEFFYNNFTPSKWQKFIPKKES